MTPQLVPQPLATQPDLAVCPSLAGPHLTDEQFAERIATSPTATAPSVALAEAHLLVCEQCAAQMASLRESICLFREASSAYADEQLRRRPRWEVPVRPALVRRFIPMYWVAAAAMFLTALLPMQVLRRNIPASPPTVAVRVADRPAQSDEALLEEVNSEISASVPTSMQALADPTADASSVSSQTSVQTSTQRKD
jgi:anti-sigma factor RsiW